ncbi:MAG: succinylglutamate desuccinylase/aspartoacylase family protein [Flavobacteriales bacterium]|nr:succinylglutamate desuccinylase/aspartoacylase family protein [Flavobacteriales bacterium]
MKEKGEIITIDGNEIALGKNAHIRCRVASLPSGTDIHINIHVYRSNKAGPKILLLGGLHGDEVNGVETVRRILSSKSLESLQRGTIIAIPLLNVYGFINFSRSVRDGKDVNRSFPGSKTGSLASRVAYMMSNHILPNIDYGIDFHTGGSTIHNLPQLRVTQGDNAALELGRIFNPPVILQNKAIPKSHRLHAFKLGKPILVFEGGESLRLDEASIQMGITGVHRILSHERMLSMPIDSELTQEFEKSKWIRAYRSGLVNLKTSSGSSVKKGQILAEIYQLDSLKKVSIKSPRDGLLIAHVNNPVVNRGDALFHIVF